MIEIIEEENVIEYIADSYGLFHQELQLIQEMSELTQAITKTMLCINDESLKSCTSCVRMIVIWRTI